MPDLTKRVLWVDPGPRPGWAAATMGINRFEAVEYGVMGLRDFALWLATKQMVNAPGFPAAVRQVAFELRTFDVIGYETWRLNANKAQAMVGDDMQASQCIGMVRLIAWLSGARLPQLDPAAKFQHPPSELIEDLKRGCNEEHPKDALDLLWHHYYKEWFDPTREPA